MLIIGQKRKIFTLKNSILEEFHPVQDKNLGQKMEKFLPTRQYNNERNLANCKFLFIFAPEYE